MVEDVRIGSGSGSEFFSRLQSSIDSVSSIHLPVELVAFLILFRNLFWGFE
jgi:hypothetical protein